MTVSIARPWYVSAVMERYRLGNGAMVDVSAGLVVVGEQTKTLPPLPWRLLLLLVRHPRQLFSRDDLLDALWPEEPEISDETLTKVVSRLRKRLGNVIQTVPKRGYRLRDPAVREIPRHRAPESSFLGREAELRALSSRMARGTRIVTLVGLAGVGKTRIAQEFLGQQSGRFVNLAEASSVDDVLVRVMRAVSARRGSDSPAALGHAIAAAHISVLVLDNAEDALEALTELLPVWATAAPTTFFVVTSREPIGLSIEQLHWIDGLGTSVAEQLLEDRSGLSIDHKIRSQFAQELDGIPLALELAAYRLQSLPADEVLALVQRRLSFLGNRHARDVHERHRSLQAVLEATWGRLSPSAQRVLVDLTAWVRPFTLEQAARTVEGSLEEVIDDIQALQRVALVRRDGARLRVAPLIRRFVAEAVPESLRLPGHRRHGELLASLATEPRLRRAHRDERSLPFHDLLAVVDDMVVACRRAVQREDRHVAVATACGVYVALRLNGPHSLLSELLDRVLPLAKPRERAIALGFRAWLYLLEQELDVAFAYAHEATELCRAAGDSVGLGYALMRLSLIYAYRNEPELAEQATEEALIQLEHHDAYGHAVATQRLGMNAIDRGDLPNAKRKFERMVRAAQVARSSFLEELALDSLGVVLQRQGWFAPALHAHQRALAVNETRGDRSGEVSIRRHIAHALACVGSFDNSLQESQQAARLGQQVEEPAWTKSRCAKVFVLQALGRLTEALSIAQDDFANATNGPEDARANATSVLAGVYRAMSEPEKAWFLLMEDQGLIERCSTYEALALQWERAHAALALGWVDRATVEIQNLAALQPQNHDFSAVIQLGCAEAELQWRLGNWEAAQQRLDETDDQLRRGHVPRTGLLGHTLQRAHQRLSNARGSER
ncbi:MAG: winged helix-turn-helix domain-containing protein [Myxococcota bacterium]